MRTLPSGFVARPSAPCRASFTPAARPAAEPEVEPASVDDAIHAGAVFLVDEDETAGGIEAKAIRTVQDDVAGPEAAGDGHGLFGITGPEESEHDLVARFELGGRSELREPRREALVGDAPADEDHGRGGITRSRPL